MKTFKLRSLFYQMFYILLGCFIMLPVFYALNISLMPADQVLSTTPSFWPRSITIENYRIALSSSPMMRFMLNSLLIATITSITRVVIASLAAYGFSFFNFKGKNTLFYLCMLALLIPSDVLTVSNYQTVARLGLINTYLGIMIIFLVNAQNIFILRQNFMTFSTEVKEATELDGCSDFKFYWKFLLPINRPAITTVFISSFIAMWNEYTWTLLVTNSTELRTVQVGVTMLNFPDGVTYGPIMAASIISLIPVVFIFIIFRKQIVGGLTAGAVKG